MIINPFGWWSLKVSFNIVSLNKIKTSASPPKTIEDIAKPFVALNISHSETPLQSGNS